MSKHKKQPLLQQLPPKPQPTREPETIQEHPAQESQADLSPHGTGNAEPSPELTSFEVAPEFSAAAGNDGQGATGGVTGPPGRLTLDQFAGMFSASLNGLGTITRLQSIRCDISQPGARAASDTLYELACEISWLNFLVDPTSKRLQQVVVLLAFFGPMSMGAAAELRARRMAARAAKAEPVSTETAAPLKEAA